MDLLRAPGLGRLLTSPLPQRGVQLALVTVYAGLVWLGWGLDAIPGVPEPHPRMYTHASTFLLWVLWFMGLVFLVPVLGRGWCGVCPLGFASELLGRWGLGRPWPRWVATGAGAVVAFGFGVAAVGWLDVHLSPHRTAVLAGGTAAVAALSALWWRRSAFCRGICPIGGVLHLYARHAPVAIQPRAPDTCAGCRDRSCTASGAEWRRWDLGNLVLQHKVHRAGCPVALDPPTMDQGACLVCLRCARACRQGNLGLYWGRKPGGRDLGGARSALLALVLGLVTVALLRTWPDLGLALTPGVRPPNWLTAAWLGLALPLAAILGPAAAARLLGALGGRVTQPPGPGPRPATRGTDPAPSLWAGAVPYLPAFVGLALGGHAALALVKLNAKITYLPYLAYDPTGAATYLAIHASGVLPVPDLWIPLATLRWLALGCLTLGTLGGLRDAWHRWPRPPRAATWLYGASFAATAALFAAALAHWLFPR